MAEFPIKLFFLDNRTYSVGRISFDLLLTESHNMSNEITEFDIEDGSTISDHIKKNLDNGSLSGLISNFSLNIFGAVTNRAQSAYNEMIRIMEEELPVTIVTVLRVYENVGITNIDVARSADTGEALILDVSFKQMNIVKLKTVQIDLDVKIPNMDTDQNRQSSPTAEVGRQVGVS